MTDYAERFPYDCMVCGEALETESSGVHVNAYEHGGEPRYDAEQDAYFVTVESDEYRRVLREMDDVEEADDLEGLLLHMKGRHVGPRGEKQPRCGIHRECGTTVREHATAFDDRADDDPEQFDSGDRYNAVIPVEQVAEAFPQLQDGDDPLAIPASQEAITFRVERMEHYEDGISLDLL